MSAGKFTKRKFLPLIIFYFRSVWIFHRKSVKTLPVLEGNTKQGVFDPIVQDLLSNN